MLSCIKMAAKVNADLQKERDTCTFNKEELTNYLDGGVKNTEDRRATEQTVLNWEELQHQIPEEYLSHKEKYEVAIKNAVYYQKTMFKNDKTYHFDLDKYRANMRNIASQGILRDFSPLSLHFGMFVATIVGQGTKEQQDRWLQRALNMEIIGTYAQTELGHGTFLRGLETTATYDPKTEEFVLHSPTLTSYKWWPGGLGHTANYAIIIAELYSNGKKCGIQPFLVQLRDEETHMPLPGVKVGEIGAKLAFNTANNGFVGFDNYRIPRDRMLMKYAQVLKDGTFKASPNPKLTYGTMVLTRVTIVNAVANLLAKASIIAVRYSAVRRQSQITPNEPECQILDYLSQQHKLFITIATSHAYTFCAKWLWDKYSRVSKDLESGQLGRLPELHMLSCGMKSVCSSQCARYVEQCRLACGGHGFMASSNLPMTYGLVTAACTYEGENTVLMLQTARSLVKAWNNDTVSSTLSYLKKNTSGVDKWTNSVEGIIRGFQEVTAGKIKSCVDNITKLTNTGMSYENAWNLTSVQLISAAEAYTRTTMLTIYKEETDNMAALSHPVRTVMLQLMELYVTNEALSNLGALLMYTTVTKTDVEELQGRYETLLQKIRPNAVGLVDAFDYCDKVLNSTLGSFDGRVYERLMEEAMKSPLNAEPVNRSFRDHLKPLMQGKL